MTHDLQEVIKIPVVFIWFKKPTSQKASPRSEGGEAFFVCSGLCSGYMCHCFTSTLTVLLPILTIATEPDRREVFSDATPVVAMTESSCTPFTP